MPVVRMLLVAAALALGAIVSTTGLVAGQSQGFQTFVVDLEPQAPNTEGSGLAVIRINEATAEVCYLITVTGIGEPTEPAAGLGAAHIHDFATRGIFVDLETDWMATGNDRNTTIGCAAADPERLAAILADPSAFFVNIHTVAFPGGALTGALG